MDIAVVDDEKTIREHICALIEERKFAEVLERAEREAKKLEIHTAGADKAIEIYAVLTVFQGYCLQYFLGSFLERRMKSR